MQGINAMWHKLLHVLRFRDSMKHYFDFNGSLSHEIKYRRFVYYSNIYKYLLRRYAKLFVNLFLYIQCLTWTTSKVFWCVYLIYINRHNITHQRYIPILSYCHKNVVTIFLTLNYGCKTFTYFNTHLRCAAYSNSTSIIHRRKKLILHVL